MFRRTISAKVSLEGRALHTGEHSKVTFLPSPTPSGIRFIRFENGEKRILPANLANAAESVRGTNLKKNGTSIRTIEHIMSAAFGLSLDDLDIEISASEPPAMDGSAKEFVCALLKAGIREKRQQKKNPFSISKQFEFVSRESTYKVFPSEKFSVRLRYLNKHPLIGVEEAIYSEGDNYLKEIAGARTFCLMDEIEFLRARGLGKGGSLKNVIVVDSDKFLAEGGLRFTNELARHKLLDFLGDLKLLNLNFRNFSVEAERTGHEQNIKFARILFEKLETQEDKWKRDYRKVNL